MEKNKAKKEEERNKNIMKEREKLRVWDPGCCCQTRVQIAGGPNLVVNWLNRRLKINSHKSRTEVQKTQKLVGPNRCSPDG